MSKALKLPQKMKTYQLVIVLSLIVLSFIRVFMHIQIPYSIHTVQFTDDGLMQKMALYLSEGDYLGTYDELTLCKNYSYAYLLALCYKTHLPYPILLGLLNIGSAFAVCQAFKKNVSFVPRAIIYALLIFSPVTFADMAALRIYRNSILQYMTLFVFAGFIALFLRKEEEGFKKLMPWIILEGVSLPLFWFVKEDSIWVLPFCVVISVMALVWIWINNRKDFIKKLIAFSIPFIATIIMGLGISTANYINYGIFTINDRSHTEASELYSNLLNIEKSDEDGPVWVTKEMYEKAADVSPSFERVWNGLQYAYGDGATVQGDLFVWRIRTIMATMGYYSDAQMANEFYGQINSELDEAFENGTLAKDNLIHLSKLMKGMSFDEIIKTIPKALKNLYHISTYKNLKLDEIGSTGTYNIVYPTQQALGCNTFIPGSGFYELDTSSIGWYIVRALRIVLRVSQKFGKITDVFAFVGFAIFFVFVIYDVTKKEYKKMNMFIVMCGIILSALLASFEIEAFTGYFYAMGDNFYDDFIGFYNVSIYPLVDVFKYVSIVLGLQELIKIIKRKKKIKKRISYG